MGRGMGKRGQKQRSRGFAEVTPLVGLLLLSCANPGQPKPPSLKLPQVSEDLQAQRVGDRVQLQWTTASTTTDNLPVPAKMVAVVCRQLGPSPGRPQPCGEVKRLAVSPGESNAEEVLPPALTSGPVGLLAYRVEILNARGRSAGRSAEVFVASGAAPAPVEALAGSPIRRAVRLEWRSGPAATAIDLDRTDTARSPMPGNATPAAPGSKSGNARERKAFAGTEGRPAEIHLNAKAADKPDMGGAVDRSAEVGTTYQYRAQRVLAASVDGHLLELRSEPSPAVSVTVLGSFPPKPPTALEAAPGGGSSRSIDLSWEPGSEVDLAGYNVYRSELPEAQSAQGSPTAGVTQTQHPPQTQPRSWIRVNGPTVPVPAFHDSGVRAGMRYAYRVTAVDTDGNESAPGKEVQETPGTR